VRRPDERRPRRASRDEAPEPDESSPAEESPKKRATTKRRRRPLGPPPKRSGVTPAFIVGLLGVAVLLAGVAGYAISASKPKRKTAKELMDELDAQEDARQPRTFTFRSIPADTPGLATLERAGIHDPSDEAEVERAVAERLALVARRFPGQFKERDEKRMRRRLREELPLKWDAQRRALVYALRTRASGHLLAEVIDHYEMFPLSTPVTDDELAHEFEVARPIADLKERLGQ
jgi:hypothetical protein